MLSLPHDVLDLALAEREFIDHVNLRRVCTALNKCINRIYQQILKDQYKIQSKKPFFTYLKLKATLYEGFAQTEIPLNAGLLKVLRVSPTHFVHSKGVNQVTLRDRKTNREIYSLPYIENNHIKFIGKFLLVGRKIYTLFDKTINVDAPRSKGYAHDNWILVRETHLLFYLYQFRDIKFVSVKAILFRENIAHCRLAGNIVYFSNDRQRGQTMDLESLQIVQSTTQEFLKKGAAPFVPYDLKEYNIYQYENLLLINYKNFLHILDPNNGHFVQTSAPFSSRIYFKKNRLLLYHTGQLMEYDLHNQRIRYSMSSAYPSKILDIDNDIVLIQAVGLYYVYNIRLGYTVCSISFSGWFLTSFDTVFDLRNGDRCYYRARPKTD